MAEDKGYWFTTEKGAHVYVEPGESKEDALRRRFGRVNGKYEVNNWGSRADGRFGKLSNFHNYDTRGNVANEHALSLYVIARDKGDTKTADAIAERYKQYEKEYDSTKTRTYTQTWTRTVEPSRWNNATKPYTKKETFTYQQNPASTKFSNDVAKMTRQFNREQDKKKKK